LLIIAICGILGRKSTFVRKIRHLCIALLGGNVNNSLNYDELAVDKNDIRPKVYRAVDIKNEANKPNQLTPPITFLTDTSIDNYFDNKRKGEKNQIIIQKLLKEHDIQVSHDKTSVMPLYTNISFELARSTDVDHVLKLKNHILHALDVETFIVTYKGNIINFEIPNVKPSKISIKSVLMTLDKINGNVATVGLNADGAPLALDFKQNPNILIIGRRGSGASMLLSSLIISLAYTNIPDDLEFVILSHIGDKSLKHFNNLQHLKVPLVNELEDVIKELHIFNAEVTRREKLIRSHKTTSISGLNSKLNNDIDRIKTLVLVITGFDKLIKADPECEKLLVNILTNSDKLNMKVILLSTNANEQALSKDINENINMRFVLKLESEAESNNIFGNNRGLQLYGNGDGYMFNIKNDRRIRFQTCYLNMNELIQIINTINSFFQFKNESL
jgi:S-DNA-T family DNA segregation ATPase FtsK/SpoIIIE